MSSIFKVMLVYVMALVEGLRRVGEDLPGGFEIDAARSNDAWLQQEAFVVSELHKVAAEYPEESDVKNSSPGDVLYLLKTYSGNYQTRLRAVMETWGAQIDPSRLIIIGDVPSDEYPVRAVRECGPRNLACRVNRGLTFAAAHPGEWKVLLLVDDDHYLQIAGMPRALAKYDVAKPTAFGCFGCGRKKPFYYCNGHGGFCGGCGYGMNRAALKSMVGDSPETFLERIDAISNSTLADRREDMATSCMLRFTDPETEVKSYRINGYHDIDHVIHGELILHHISPEQMLRVHDSLTHQNQRRSSWFDSF